MLHKDEFLLPVSSRLSASSNEWVPVFRAQPAAMNKMAFKAFFITAFSHRATTAQHRIYSGSTDQFFGCFFVFFFKFSLLKMIAVFSKRVVILVRILCAPRIQDNMVVKGCRLCTRIPVIMYRNYDFRQTIWSSTSPFRALRLFYQS